jgi:hypothetical protein
MGERWETVEEITAARERFETAIPGWRRPAAYGVGRLDADGSVVFARVNVGSNPLPAVVLATVCGHRVGSASYRVGRPVLERAVELLAPAEACTAFGHPNLWAWRDELLPALGPDDTVVAVFAVDLDAADGDPDLEALLAAARETSSD